MMSAQLRTLNGKCDSCGFAGKVFVLKLSDAEKAQMVRNFRVWHKSSLGAPHTHTGLELETKNGGRYFIEKCSQLVQLSRPRRVDSSGEWMGVRVKRTLSELEMLPIKMSDTVPNDTCADVADMLWDALMHQ